MRQWPGNGADLDFRGVIRRGRAVLVAAAPPPGVVSEKIMRDFRDLKAYLASPAFEEHKKSLAFCRLWCIVELYAGLECDKPIIFRCCRTTASARGVVSASAGKEATNVLFNFSHMADARTAECAVPADKKREMDRIGEGLSRLNTTVRAALGAGSQAAIQDAAEVEAYACGELEAARALRGYGRVAPALSAAAAAGLADLVSELLGAPDLDEEGPRRRAEALRQP